MATKRPTGQLRQNASRAEIVTHAAKVSLGDIDAPAWQKAIAAELIQRIPVKHLRSVR